MSEKDLLVGILLQDGYLKTESGRVLLTTIPLQAAQSPESAAIKVSPEDNGKMALVKGNLSGRVLYSANIIETIPSVTSSLIKTLIDKGIVSFEDLRVQVSKPETIGERQRERLCALVIGHKKTSPGAVNLNQGLTEFEFNEELARRIEGKIRDVRLQRVYRRTYKDLPDDINSLDPDFIVSLHCNSFNTEASGTEVLYYHRSTEGREIARILLDRIAEHLRLPVRGIKPRTAEDRGGYLLRYTKAPCVIAEPFFIDNDKDLARAQEDLDGLAGAYARAIEDISAYLASP